VDLGYNYRLTDIQCALGLSQLAKLDRFVQARRRIARRYAELLKGVPPVGLPPHHPGHSYHLYPIRVPAERRRDVFEALRREGVGVQVHYLPVHMHPYYKDLYGIPDDDLPNALNYYRETISLPMFPSLEDHEQDRVVELLSSYLG